MQSPGGPLKAKHSLLITCQNTCPVCVQYTIDDAHLPLLLSDGDAAALVYTVHSERQTLLLAAAPAVLSFHCTQHLICCSYNPKNQEKWVFSWFSYILHIPTAMPHCPAGSHTTGAA